MAIEHENIGVINVSRVQTGGTRLVGSAIESDTVIEVSLYQGQADQSIYHKEQIRALRANPIVTIQMSTLQWGEFTSSMGIGMGSPCTIVDKDGQRVPQTYQTSAIDDYIYDATKSQLSKFNDKYGEKTEKINEILEKKSINKSDREIIKEAINSIHRLFNDDLPFIQQISVEETQKHLVQAQAQFKTEMQALIDKYDLKKESAIQLLQNEKDNDEI